MTDTVPNGGVIVDGQVWTAAQWNSAWTSKVDATNGSSLGQTLTNPTITGATYVGNDLSLSDAIASGAITSRTLADHFGDIVFAKDFGAVFDGNSHPLSAYFSSLAAAQAVYPNAIALTDEIDGVAIQAAINFCQARVVNFSYGGTVIVPQGKGLINQPLTITKSSVSLESQGRGFNMTSNVQRSNSSAPTRFTWTGAPVIAGAAQNRMLTVAPTLAIGRCLTGNNVLGILFDCGGIAGTAGPLFESTRYSEVDVATYEPAGVAYPGASLTSGSQVVAVSSTTGLRLGESVVSPSLPDGCYVASIINGTTFNASAQATATTSETVVVGGEGIRFDVVDALQDANDTQLMRVRFVGTNLLGGVKSAAPLVFIGGSGVIGASGGTHFGNTSVMWFDSISLVINNGHGIVCNNSDHNFHENINSQKIGVGSGKALICNGSLDSNNGGARWHYFRHIAGDTYFIGTDTGGFNQAAIGCTIYVLDRQNGSPPPVVGTGAYVRAAADNQPTLGAMGGTEALVRQLPDSTTVGGNTRGASAADLQSVRTAATQVASGPRSVIAGGNGNTASATECAVGGGLSNIASGQWSTVPGGNGNVAAGTNSTAIGTGANTSLFASFAQSGGTISSGRRAQAEIQVLRAVSGTNTTPVRLTADGAAAGSANVVNLISVGATQVDNLHVQLVAIDSTNNNNFYIWTQPIGLLYRFTTNSTTTYTPGTPVSLSGGTTTGIAVTEAADTTNGGYSLTFTPPTGNTSVWKIAASVRFTRVDGG